MSSQSEREVVYCHSCQQEWYRDEHGIVCPYCESDFTEVIEPNHDPREDNFDDGFLLPLDRHEDRERHEGHGGHESSGSSPPELAPDPDEDDVGGLHWTATGPNTYAVRGTIRHTIGGPNRGADGAPGPDGPGGFLQSLLGNMMNPNQPQAIVRTAQSPNGGTTITYSTTTRVFPRNPNDPDAPQPPVDDIGSILAELIANVGGIHQQNNPGGSAPPNPFMLLPGLLGGLGQGQFGDAVFSNEAFDRVMSQLMEQNTAGNAPGPAPAEAIAALPKKKIDASMLGDNGKADCSICMESVELGDEVTELYCRHWFHTDCVASWLNEHDTCPHCRQGIEATKQSLKNTAEATSTSDQMPGKSPTGQAESSSRNAEGYRQHTSSDSGLGASNTASISGEARQRDPLPSSSSNPSSQTLRPGIATLFSQFSTGDGRPPRHYSQMDQPESPPRTRRTPSRQDATGETESSRASSRGRRRSSGNEGFTDRVRNLFGSRQN